MFDVVLEIKELANYIEGKLPTDIEDYLNEKAKHFRLNGIVDNMHVGKEGEWEKEEIAQWLLSQFIGTIDRASNNKVYYNALGTWYKYVHHYFINTDIQKKEPI